MSTIIRGLSIHEASFPVYAKLSPGGGNIVVCLNLRGQLSPTQAANGFQQLMQAEASLQVGCKWEQKNIKTGRECGYYFVKPDDSELPFTSETLSTNSEFETTNSHVRTKLLNQPFREGNLLWRAHLISEKSIPDIIPQHSIFLCINHSISDGTSVYHLMKRWLLALNSTTKIAATANPFSLPLWQYMPKKIAGIMGAFRSLSILSTFIKAQKLADGGLSFNTETNVPIAEHRCMSTYRTLDSGSFSSLLKISKSQNKSIHGLMSAALMQVLLKDCQQRNTLQTLPNSFSFPFVTTVNVRDKIQTKKNKSIPIDDAIAGCLSSGVTSMVNVNQDLIDNDYLNSPWLLGQQVTKGIESALAQDQHWKVLRIYKIAGLKGLKKMFIDSSEKPLATPISFANLGPVKFDFYINRATTALHEALTVTGYQAYAAFHASGAGVNVVASSLHNELTLCFTCPDPVISKETLNTYANDVVALLQSWA